MDKLINWMINGISFKAKQQAKIRATQLNMSIPEYVTYCIEKESINGQV